MRVAWFGPHPPAAAHPIDDTPSLVAELGSRHQIDLYDERRAHDFVWRQWQSPYDVCVYELTDTPAAAFIWPYLLHYPGIVRLRSASLARSRADALLAMHRSGDYAAEVDVAGREALGIPIAASRLAVVGDSYIATALQDAYPDARIRHAPLAEPGGRRETPPPRSVPVFGVIGTTATHIVTRAADRARDAGAPLDLRFEVTTMTALLDCDAVVSLHWPPPPEPPLGALCAMAAGIPAIVYETAVTAPWGALDPQTWQPRGFVTAREPIVVSIDPRDAEHSLMRSLQRLATDAALRKRLGDDAREWSGSQATVQQAAAAWDALLEEAVVTGPPRLPAGWPRHLTPDGGERARALLAAFGLTVDFLS